MKINLRWNYWKWKKIMLNNYLNPKKTSNQLFKHTFPDAHKCPLLQASDLKHIHPATDEGRQVTYYIFIYCNGPYPWRCPVHYRQLWMCCAKKNRAYRQCTDFKLPWTRLRAKVRTHAPSIRVPSAMMDCLYDALKSCYV